MMEEVLFQPRFRDRGCVLWRSAISVTLQRIWEEDWSSIRFNASLLASVTKDFYNCSAGNLFV